MGDFEGPVSVGLESPMRHHPSTTFILILAFEEKVGRQCLAGSLSGALALTFPFISVPLVFPLRTKGKLRNEWKMGHSGYMRGSLVDPRVLC